jgi:thiosulfate dehydrogenase
MNRRAPTISLACLALAACGTDTTYKDVTVTKTAIEHGQALFHDPSVSAPALRFACATCHTAEPLASDRRILPGAPLGGVTERPTFFAGQENDLLEAINACRAYFMDVKVPWAADDDEAQAMYAYLASLPPTETGPVSFTVVPSVADLPAGDATRGQDVYDRACLSCHGALHSGGGRLTESAVVLPEAPKAEHELDGFDETESRVVFIEKIRHGGFFNYGGNMPPYSLEALTDAQVGDLLSYLDLY